MVPYTIINNNITMKVILYMTRRILEFLPLIFLITTIK